MKQELTNQKERAVDPPPVNTPRSLVRIAFGAVLYSVAQCCLNSFGSIVDWTKMPDMHTVLVVLHQMKAAAALGFIRGVLLAFMCVLVVWLGPSLWGIAGPVIGSAARRSLVFVGALARAMRAKGAFDPRNPLDLSDSRTDTDGKLK